ncbi:MAG: hypothetical protein ACOYL6_07235 [Bacteriovoracaceae bacterium]
MLKWLLAFSFFYSLQLYAGAYEGFFVGEKNPPDYQGPTKPVFHYNLYRADVQMDEVEENERPLTNKIVPDLTNMSQFMQEDFLQSSLCPNETLAQNADYMRYLYRLISLSYLYEELEQHRETLTKLGLSDHSCFVSWKEVLNQCKPKTDEMTKFVRRAGQVVASYKYVLPQDHSFKKYMTSWQESLKKKNNDLSISLKRLKIYCDQNKLHCKLSQMDSLNRAFHGVCVEDWTLFKSLCSEDDLLFGMSKLKFPQELILNSNVAHVLNGEGNAKECLERFSKWGMKRETRQVALEQMMPLMYLYAKKNLPTRFLYGRLFLPGALKEFDDKGLKEFLYAEATATPTPTPSPTPSVVVVVKTATPTPSPTPTPKIVKTIVPTPVPTKVVVRKSTFLVASEKVDRERVRSVALDMALFKEDFVLTEDFKVKMEERLKPFQTRKALSDMKEFDFLGTKEVPLKLLFLKYLIETDQHQGLFNIQSIIGTTFWVLNDIDRLPKNEYYSPRFIELKNDGTTGNKWLISILHESRANELKAAEAKATKAQEAKAQESKVNETKKPSSP